MISWLTKAARILVIILVIATTASITFDKLLKKTRDTKPSISVIPEEIKPARLVNNYPLHNQFLVGAPPSIVINFDTPITKSSGSLKVNGKDLKNSLSQTEKSLILIPILSDNLENGIYTVEYNACFGDKTCSGGQLSYHIDETRVTEFANNSTKNLVEINVDENLPKSTNILINYQAAIKWNNKTQNSIEINSQPPIFNNYFPQLNSGEIKKDQSFKYQFLSTGEFIWYLKNDPHVGGRILVQ